MKGTARRTASSALQARCPAPRMHPKNLITPTTEPLIQEALKRGVQPKVGDQGLHFVVVAEAKARPAGDQ